MTPTTRRIAGKGITMNVLEAGEGRPVILCHGFPELSSSWRHQIPALAAAGHHVLAPDMRGYGDTDAPGAVEAYAMTELVGDVVALIDSLGVERAAVVGHDWGAMVAWQVALAAPERLAGVAALSVPFSPRFPMPPTELFESFFPGQFMYMLYFQEPGVAEAELERDIRAFLLRMYWTAGGARPAVAGSPWPREGTGYLDTLAAAPDSVPTWLADHLDPMARSFARSGMRGPLNWYRNLDRNWEESAAQAQAHVTVPAFFITGDNDPIAGLLPASGMDGWVDDLRGAISLPGVGHWTGEENPEAVNAALLGFLGGLAW